MRLSSVVGGLLASFALQACSDKTVTAPAAPAVAVKVPAPVTPPPLAPAAEPAKPTEPASFEKKANLQCLDRKIELKATCVNIWETSRLACTSQRLIVTDLTADKELNVRQFLVGKPEVDEPGIIDGNFGDISCVATQSNEKYIVAMMSRSRGGNCAECEWVDVYSWDGLLLGTSGGEGGKSQVQTVSDAIEAANDPKAPPLAKIEIDDFYYDPTDK